MDVIAYAHELAARHPRARLPCPACGSNVNADQLARHLANDHAGFAAPPSPWRGKGALGLMPCSVAFEGDALVLRHSLGLGRRVVDPPYGLEVGTLLASRRDPIMSNTDTNAITWEPAGYYLRVLGNRTITIGCHHDGELADSWDTERVVHGDRRKRCSVLLKRPAIVAVEYELARRGILSPATR